MTSLCAETTVTGVLTQIIRATLVTAARASYCPGPNKFWQSGARIWHSRATGAAIHGEKTRTQKYSGVAMLRKWFEIKLWKRILGALLVFPIAGVSHQIDNPPSS